MTSEAKLNKRKTKYSSILFRLYGLNPCSGPTEALMVCNVGLTLGLNTSDLLDFFGKFGKIQSIVMVPKESHSFLKFSSIVESEDCFNRCNGQLSLPSMKGPIFLLYLTEIPQIPSDIFDKPPGCLVFPDFVTEEEETALIESVKDSYLDNGNLKQRKVAHFGYEFLYGKNDIDKNNPLSRKLPRECDFLKERLISRGFELSWTPDQLTVNHYLPGQGIPPHIDTHSAFEDPIISLSLKSDSVMDFRCENKHLIVPLPRRSLVVMSGESRYAWTHGIPSRKRDVTPDENGCLISKERQTRISFTFRKIRHSPCDCDFNKHCDSWLSLSRKDLTSSELETKYVHDIYDNISDHFSRTRHKPWPAILDIVSSLKIGSIIVDVGCGNCKYFGFSPSTYEIGCDYSFGLLNISSERGFQAVRVNCLALPFKDGTVDLVLCIAVIHHLSSEDRRIQSIKEILRVLNGSGKALVYVWAKDQQYKGKPSNYIKSNLKAEFPVTADVGDFPVHVNRTDFSSGPNDLLVPWKLKTESSAEPSDTFFRYYHVFDEGELEDLCCEAGANIVRSYYDNGNWCCLFEAKK